LLQLIPTKNTQALENAIIKAITTKKAEIDVREIMRNKFSWKNNIIKYYEIYKEISKLRVAFMSPF
jgi:glycosyltransferase involved in cell wall biosynthesis